MRVLRRDRAAVAGAPDQLQTILVSHTAVEERRASLPWQIELGDMRTKRTHIRKEQDGVSLSGLATLPVANRQAVDDVRASVGPALAGTS